MKNRKTLLQALNVVIVALILLVHNVNPNKLSLFRHMAVKVVSIVLISALSLKDPVKAILLAIMFVVIVQRLDKRQVALGANLNATSNNIPVANNLHLLNNLAPADGLDDSSDESSDDSSDDETDNVQHRVNAVRQRNNNLRNNVVRNNRLSANSTLPLANHNAVNRHNVAAVKQQSTEGNVDYTLGVPNPCVPDRFNDPRTGNYSNVAGNNRSHYGNNNLNNQFSDPLGKWCSPN